MNPTVNQSSGLGVMPGDLVVRVQIWNSFAGRYNDLEQSPFLVIYVSSPTFAGFSRYVDVTCLENNNVMSTRTFFSSALLDVMR